MSLVLSSRLYLYPQQRYALAPRTENGRRCRRRWRSYAGEEGSEVRQLPIFPLRNLVALPGCTTPLFIFEARYRVLFNTLLAGEDDLDEELIQEESPFCGSREFGMCMVGDQGMLSIGTLLNVQRFNRQDNGQMVVENKGNERFKVLQVLKKEPIVVCEVEMLPDVSDDIPSEEIRQLSEEVCELYRNVVKLTQKMNGAESEDYTDPDEFEHMDARELSFFFASMFVENPYEQQRMLEERSCRARLLREKQVFGDAVKYLSARCALKGAFQSDT